MHDHSAVRHHRSTGESVLNGPAIARGFDILFGPEARWKVAGGASHRNRPGTESRPGWGGGSVHFTGIFRRPSGTRSFVAILSGGLRHRLPSTSPAGLTQTIYCLIVAAFKQTSSQHGRRACRKKSALRQGSCLSLLLRRISADKRILLQIDHGTAHGPELVA